MALERLERHMAKVIRAVLRGGGDSNAASLPDTVKTKVKPDSRKDTLARGFYPRPNPRSTFAATPKPGG
jgi:hypothetical protein